MAKRATKHNYFNKERMDKINRQNKMYYEVYRKSKISRNRDVESTTYKVYYNNFMHFLAYLAEYNPELELYDTFFLKNAVDIMDGYIYLLSSELGLNKKTINNKLSAVSSFFVWSVKQNKIEAHPFDGKLERMKGADKEKIIAEHFLTEEEVEKITRELQRKKKKYDLQDRLIWSIMVESCNRVGAISKCTLSSLNLEEMYFDNIREKGSEIVQVAFEIPTKNLIKKWLEERENLDECEVDSLFITKYNGEYKPMTIGTIQRRVKKIGEILGLKDFRAHSIRKTGSNLIFEQTGDMTLASRILNHKSIDTTNKHYIKEKTQASLREELARKRKEHAEKNKN